MDTNDFPLVSIIIPVYNHATYIEQTLDSIVNDTYPNKEILIINDGSTDNSHEVIENWVVQNSHTIHTHYINRENKGVSYTINELFDCSSGQYILGLGSDDYLINNTISKRVNLLKNNPQKLMVIGDAIVVNAEGKITHESGNFEFHHGKKKNYFTDWGLKYEIIRNWSVVGPVIMFDRKIFDIIGRYDNSLIVEDWDFYLRAVSKDLIVFLDQKVAAYRVHGNNTISNPKVALEFRRSMMQAARQNIKYFWFPFNFWLWRKYRRNKKKYEKLLSKQGSYHA